MGYAKNRFGGGSDGDRFGHFDRTWSGSFLSHMGKKQYGQRTICLPRLRIGT